MGEAREHKRIAKLQEQRGQCSQKGKKMEDCPCMHFVDSMERKQQEMF